MDKITITKDEYFTLRKAELELNLLEVSGVDNWDYYSDALNPDGEPSYDEKIEQLKKEIFKGDK